MNNKYYVTFVKFHLGFYICCFSSSIFYNQVEALQLELDGYIAADCPLCGYVMIRSLSVPLITPEDSEEAKAWAL